MNDTEARDQLGLTISAYWRNSEVAWDEDLRLADHLLEQGWRPPVRTVTTVEELDALADMSVIRDAQDRVMRLCDGEFYEVGYEVDVWPTLPATVLYEPKEDE